MPESYNEKDSRRVREAITSKDVCTVDCMYKNIKLTNSFESFLYFFIFSPISLVNFIKSSLYGSFCNAFSIFSNAFSYLPKTGNFKIVF